MTLIEDKRATPELRKNLNTAGGLTGVAPSSKKRIKKKFDFTPLQTEEAQSIGILEDDKGILQDESRVNQELGLDNFIIPRIENASEYPTERNEMNIADDSGFFEFHPYEADNYFKDAEDRYEKHNKSEGIGLKSILDSVEKSSIINSDILSSDAKDFGFLKSGPMWHTKGFEEVKTKLSDVPRMKSRKSSESPAKSQKFNELGKLASRQSDPRSSESPERNPQLKSAKIVGQRRGTLLRFQQRNPLMNQTLESTVVGFKSRENVNETEHHLDDTAAV